MAQTRLHEELPCKSASHGDLEMPPSERRLRELPFSHAARPVACAARSLAGGPLRLRRDCPPRQRGIKVLTSPGTSPHRSGSLSLRSERCAGGGSSATALLPNHPERRRSTPYAVNPRCRDLLPLHRGDPRWGYSGYYS